MIVLNSLTPKFIGVGMSVLSSTRIEQEFLVDPEETLIPEQVFVEDVGGDNLGGNTAREVFDSLPLKKLAYCQEDLKEKHALAIHHQWR